MLINIPPEDRFGNNVPVSVNGNVTRIPVGVDVEVSVEVFEALVHAGLDIDGTNIIVPQGEIYLSPKKYGARLTLAINGIVRHLMTGVAFYPTADDLAALQERGLEYLDHSTGLPPGTPGGATPSPTPGPTLGPITLTGSLTQGTIASSVNLTGLTDGSTVSFNIAGLSTTTSGTTRPVSGTPATSGTLNVLEILANATNSPRPSNGVATVAAAGAALAISGSPGSPAVGDSTVFTPSLTGGTPPYTVTLLSGTLPDGRALVGNSITGTYTTAGSYSFTLRVTDSAIGTPGTADLAVNVTVAAVSAPITASQLWMGADDTTGEIVQTALFSGAGTARMAVSTSPTDFSAAVYGPSVSIDNTTLLAKMRSPTGLSPGTTYHTRIEANGTLQTTPQGKSVVPRTDAHSFKQVILGCADYNTNSGALEAIVNDAPVDVFWDGDFHYENITGVTGDQSTRLAAYAKCFSTSGNVRRRALLAGFNNFYMMDDHDSGNYPVSPGTGETIKTNTAGIGYAKTAYMARVPHPPLGNAGEIYFSYRRGRIVTIVTNNRHYRDRELLADSSSKSQLGTVQKTWFKAQLAAARSAGLYVNWMTSVPPYGPLSFDNWSSYQTEMRELMAYAASIGMHGRMCITTGDRHAVAISRGTNFDIGREYGMNIPVMICNAIEHNFTPGSQDGEWDVGCEAGEHQYALVEYTDTGGSTIGITWRSRKLTTSTNPLSVTDRFTTSFVSAPLTGTATAPVPSAPTAITATAGNNSVALTYRDDYNGGFTPTAARIYRRTGANAFALLIEVSNVRNYTDSTAANGTAYDYQVAFVSAAGEGPKSSTASATPVGSDTFPITTGVMADWDFNDSSRISTTTSGSDELIDQIIPSHRPSFTADVAGTVLNVTALDAASNTIRVGMELYGTSIPAGTRITALGTGTGGVGTYTLSADIGTIASGPVKSGFPLKATGTLRPKKVTAGVIGAARFEGAQRMDAPNMGPAFINTENYVIICVADVETVDGTVQTFVDCGVATATGSFSRMMLFANGAADYRFRKAGSATTNGDGIAGVVSTAPHILIGRASSAGTQGILNLDNLASATATSGATLTNNYDHFCIGDRIATTGAPLKGRIRRVVVLGGDTTVKMDTTKLAALYAWAQAQGGVA